MRLFATVIVKAIRNPVRCRCGQVRIISMWVERLYSYSINSIRVKVFGVAQLNFM